MSSENLTETTRKLYRERPRGLSSKQVSADTNLPLLWLQDFGHSRTEKPNGVSQQRIQILHDYLVASKAGA